MNSLKVSACMLLSGLIYGIYSAVVLHRYWVLCVAILCLTISGLAVYMAYRSMRIK